MRVAVVGLGQVGLVNAVCLAAQHHTVVGVDIDTERVEVLRAGQSPVKEPELETFVSKQVESGRLRVVDDISDGITHCEASLICVGTPGDGNGGVDLSQIEAAFSSIGEAVARAGKPHSIVIRSTVPPGTTQRLERQVASEFGLRPGVDLFVAVCPEFQRAGSSIRDFLDPPYTIVGTEHAGASELLMQLFGFVSGPLWVVAPEEAELLKYACNAFHATKVAFANEIGRVARAHDIDGERVMELLAADRVLNASDAYLRPGLPFGGSCLPKDLEALTELGKAAGVQLPLLEGVASSNQVQLERAYRTIARAVAAMPGKVGMVGLSFKPGTNDLRDSPAVAIVERLLSDGIEVDIFDETVSPEELPVELGSRLVPDVGSLAASSEVLIVDGRCVEKLTLDEALARGTVIIRLDELLNGHNGRVPESQQPSPRSV